MTVEAVEDGGWYFGTVLAEEAEEVFAEFLNLWGVYVFAVGGEVFEGSFGKFLGHVAACRYGIGIEVSQSLDLFPFCRVFIPHGYECLDIGIGYGHGQREHRLEGFVVFVNPGRDESGDINIENTQGFGFAEIPKEGAGGECEYREAEEDSLQIGMIVEYTVVRGFKG